MSSILFLIAMVAVIYVLLWAIRNDSAGDNGPTEGLFRMKHDDARTKQDPD